MGRRMKRLETTGLEVLHIFTRKMLVSQFNIRGVFRCYASINLFWLIKILFVLVITKQYQPFCVRTFNFLPRCFVVYIICQWKNKLLKFFTICHLPVSLHSFYFNTEHLHLHSNVIATYSCILANKVLPFFVTLPTPFLITFLLTRQVLE